MENNRHPHAPWWTVDEASLFGDDYNPTACLAGFIVRFAEKGSPLHTLGMRIAGEACAQLLDRKRENDCHGNDMHTTLCYLRLCQYLQDAGESADAMLSVLADEIDRCLDKNPDVWAESYACRPSQFFLSREDLAADRFRELSLAECDVIARTQLADGSWSIPWSWDAYPKEWAISECWWKADMIIRYVRFLGGMR